MLAKPTDRWVTADSYEANHWCGQSFCAYCNPPEGQEHVMIEPAPAVETFGQPAVPKHFRLATRPDVLTRTGVDMPAHSGHTFCMSLFQSTEEEPHLITYADPEPDDPDDDR